MFFKSNAVKTWFFPSSQCFFLHLQQASQKNASGWVLGGQEKNSEKGI
jgi:hypothetical protein